MLFGSIRSAGLLTGATAAALFPLLGWVAFPLVGLTIGIARRSVRGGLVGLAVAFASCCVFGFGSSFLLTVAGRGVGPFVCVHYSGGPPPPWPDLDTHWPHYVFLLLASLLGAATADGLWKQAFLRGVSAGLSTALLVATGAIFRAWFPPTLSVTEPWEFLTILIAGPVVGLGAWLPAELLCGGGGRLVETRSQATRAERAESWSP